MHLGRQRKGVGARPNQGDSKRFLERVERVERGYGLVHRPSLAAPFRCLALSTAGDMRRTRVAK